MPAAPRAERRRRRRSGRSAAAPRGRSGAPAPDRGSPAPASCRAATWPANSRSMISRAGGLVEIAGRLVGDQDRRVGRQRARQRDALLLAARQLRRIMVAPLGQADGVELARRRALKASATPASSSGTATFSSAVMVGMRWKDWNTMPILRPRKRASASSLELPSASPGDHDRAGIRPAPARPSPSAGSTCPSRTGRPGRSPRRALYAGRCP